LLRWANVALGIWLVFAGITLAPAGSAPRLAEVVAGAALVLVSLGTRPGSVEGVAAIVLGGWLMLAPAALGYPGSVSAAVDVFSGLAVVAVALRPHLARSDRRALRA
jgi:hypothetical protein